MSVRSKSVLAAVLLGTNKDFYCNNRISNNDYSSNNTSNSSNSSGSGSNSGGIGSNSCSDSNKCINGNSNSISNALIYQIVVIMLVKCKDDDDDIDNVDIKCYLLFYYNFIVNNDK